MADVVALREESERLGREREEIDNRLRKFDPRQNRGRRFENYPNEDHDNRPNKRQRADLLDSNRTGPKLLSSIAVVKSDPDRFATEGDRSSTVDETQKPQQEAYMKPVTVQRNKRMFGALMGHLNSAQKNLQHDSELIEKQDHRKILATQKNTIESQRVAKLHKVVTREQKDKELNLRDAVVAKQAKVEITIATATWKEQQKKLENFLLTVCEPRLAWLPGKPSVVTESMISNRAEEVAEAILKREVEDEKRIARIDSDVAAKVEQRRLQREKMSDKTEEIDDAVEDAEKIQDDHREGAPPVVADEEDEDNDGDDILAALDGRQNPYDPPMYED